MGAIKIEYTFMEKSKNNSKSLLEIIEEIIDDIAVSRNHRVIKLQGDNENEGLQYILAQSVYSHKCYLKLETINLRINKAIQHLQILDKAIATSASCKYYDCIKEYDGISERYSNRLYPKYAKYERLLRQLILTILTDAYGNSWDEATIPSDKLKDYKKKIREDSQMSTVLEGMPLSALELYLFNKTDDVFQKMVQENFWNTDVTQMKEEELCKIIREMKPTSLWERNFSECGDSETWKSNINAVYNVRNKVAHHRTITEIEYKKTNCRLNNLIKDLENTITQIQNRQYTEKDFIDIWGNFSAVVNAIKNVIDTARTQSPLTNAINVFTQSPAMKTIKALEQSTAKSAINNFSTQIQETIAPLIYSSPALKDDIDLPKFSGLISDIEVFDDE